MRVVVMRQVLRVAVAGGLHALRLCVVDAGPERFWVFECMSIVVIVCRQRVFEFFHIIRGNHDGALALLLGGVFLVVRTFWANLNILRESIELLVWKVVEAFGAVSNTIRVVVGGRVMRVCGFGSHVAT